MFPPDHKAAKSRNRKAKQPREGGIDAGARINSLQRKFITNAHILLKSQLGNNVQSTNHSAPKAQTQR